jgi:hypothetical protein
MKLLKYINVVAFSATALACRPAPAARRVPQCTTSGSVTHCASLGDAFLIVHQNLSPRVLAVGDHHPMASGDPSITQEEAQGLPSLSDGHYVMVTEHLHQDAPPDEVRRFAESGVHGTYVNNYFCGARDYWGVKLLFHNAYAAHIPMYGSNASQAEFDYDTQTSGSGQFFPGRIRDLQRTITQNTMARINWLLTNYPGNPVFVDTGYFHIGRGDPEFKIGTSLSQRLGNGYRGYIGIYIFRPEYGQNEANAIGLNNVRWQDQVPTDGVTILPLSTGFYCVIMPYARENNPPPPSCS